MTNGKPISKLCNSIPVGSVWNGYYVQNLQTAQPYGTVKLLIQPRTFYRHLSSLDNNNYRGALAFVLSCLQLGGSWSLATVSKAINCQLTNIKWKIFASFYRSLQIDVGPWGSNSKSTKTGAWPVELLNTVSLSKTIKWRHYIYLPRTLAIIGHRVY